MEKKMLTREEIVLKYLKYPVMSMTPSSDEEYIFYYEEFTKLLKDLKNEVEDIKIRNIKEGNSLNIKQKNCKNKVYIKDSGWDEEYQQFRQSYYEMQDYIYHPGFKDDYEDQYLTKKEIEDVLVMINFLIDIANKLTNFHRVN